ncbi:hypothetical protein [Szabonella alba]|uniref:Uncharacterized protein n=1 Tax=Szabonella alba TaxID=2804194 RepID=A0A8K0XYW4_9RHOB|nr:hypothetical protein [Szabonella alba]MBL4916171.1 hypothetical protein [Szabonella alba]
MQARSPLPIQPPQRPVARSLRAACAALMLSALLILPQPLLADPAPANPGLTDLQRMELSMRLHRAGRAAGDAVLLLAAARLRQSVAPLRAADWPVLPEGDAMAHGASSPLNAADMLAQARRLAEGQDALLALIEDAEAERMKGVASGPLHRLGTIAPDARDRYEALPFRGGEYAEVYAEAQGGADLLLTVLDAEGRTVCADSDNSAIAYCGWRPERAGEFTIILENRGEGASYALMTN